MLINFFKKIFFLLFFVCFCSLTHLKAQNYTFNDTLKWYVPQTNRFYPSQPIQYIGFQNCVFLNTKKNIPAFHLSYKLTKKNDIISNVSLKNIKYIALTDSELAALGNKKSVLSSNFTVYYHTGFSKKLPFAEITVISLRNDNGTIEKLLSFQLVVNIGYKPNQNLISKSNKFLSNSVLASGKWYKIAITKDGVYKLNYDFLKSLGIDVKNINPKNIRIYGNGGLQMPERNNAPRQDDLTQNDIYVAGENDGIFNKGDYVLFYGKGPVKIALDTATGLFYHKLNQYSDSSYYYINVDLGIGARISNQNSSAATPNKYITTFNAFQYYEKEQENLLKSSNLWLGEAFNEVLTYNFKFDFPNIVASQPVNINTRVAARSDDPPSQNYFEFNANGNIKKIGVSGVATSNYEALYAALASGSFSFNTSNSLINVNVSYSKPQQIAEGWLDYIDVNAMRNLDFYGIQMDFRSIASVGLGNISKFEMGDANSNIKIWDISDFLHPKSQNFNLSGSNLSFTLPTDSLKNFIAFTSGDSTHIYNEGIVANQNLHAITQADLIIVYYPKFSADAKKLADFHKQHDNITVTNVSTQEVYNEFSSGEPDPVGIRDFVRMLYERANTSSELPKYLLFIGSASYDYKNILNNNTNYIPTYESSYAPFDPDGTYNTDDFYGLLDNTESSFDITNSGIIDIGLGRLPVTDNTQLDAIVHKIINYNTPATMHDWRNKTLFVADDEDIPFMSNTDALTNLLKSQTKQYNINKIYLDAYKEYTTPGGQRYPDVQKAIVNNIEQGTLVTNYYGHGGPVGWAHERVLDLNNINTWTNDKALTFFITATCEFSPFDDPATISAGEYVLFNPSGGGIGLLTSVRATFTGQDINIDNSFFRNGLTKWHNRPTLGYIMLKTKQSNPTDGLKFVLLGDPALALAYPKYDIHTTFVNNDTTTVQDTLRALSKVTIKGYVSDTSGNKLTNFNGILYPTVYGKISNITTLNNDGDGAYTFPMRKAILFKGQASVTNGNFNYSFIVPKDIAYNYGTGKLSHYAQNGEDDAAGNYENLIIGGTDTNHAADNMGPTIQLYMNNKSFVNGGMTNENPIFLAYIFDEHGINMTGNGVGHNITAVIDANTTDAIILNDYYTADLNSYQSGSINYPLHNLTEGKHTITLTVWDVYNNSAQATLDFYVVNSKKLQLSHVLNYPNPFTTHTEFMFESNQAGTNLNIQIQIFTITGKLVKTIYDYRYAEGFRIHDIYWNGKDDFGDKLARGVYIYKLKVTAGNGTSAEKIEKLVLL